MAKPQTNPTLYDNALQMSIKKLNGWGYLKDSRIINTQLDWSRNGKPIGSISIQVNTLNEQPYIELDYNFRDEPRNYKVNLVCVPSNLGKGKIWYFLCPETNKKCRVLYSIGGYFLHREAFKGCMYRSQIESKKEREIGKLAIYFQTDKVYDEIYSKHFKKWYNGKPTKRYLRLSKKLQQAERISESQVMDVLLNRF